MRDPSINSIPKNSEKVNTFDEKISKSLNDEDPPTADNVGKHSQDELRAELVALRKQLLEVCKKVNRSVDSLNKKQ